MQTKSILTKYALIVLAFCSFTFHSCNQEKAYPPLPFVDFTSELGQFAESGKFKLSDFRALQKKHKRIFELWLNEILDFNRYENPTDSFKAEMLGEFIMRNKPVFEAIKKHYSHYPKIMQQAGTSFGKLNDLLGDVKKPVVYSYFSQFSNYNTFIDTAGGRTVLAFSSEMFMNDTFPLYKLLEVPDFFNRYNATDQIPAMLLWNYLKGRYETGAQGQAMIDEAVFNGKIWYTMEQVLGPNEIWKHLGYTEAEWKMMLADEGQIWRNYLNNDILFSKDFNEYKRFFIYGNYTYGGGVPDKYPPLLGNFTGYRIVSAYMKKTGATISDMWKLTDGSQMLRQSAYNPIK